jgi:hypothetical protein
MTFSMISGPAAERPVSHETMIRIIEAARDFVGRPSIRAIALAGTSPLAITASTVTEEEKEDGR